MTVLTLWRRKTAPTAWCAGCDSQRPACAMNWDSIGQYRCRSCNPDPGPPHDAQSPSQHARSVRYAKANGHRYRCTECGTKLASTSTNRRGTTHCRMGVELCDQCIGDECDDIHQWLGMDIIVRY